MNATTIDNLTEITRNGQTYTARYEVPVIEFVKIAHPVYTNVKAMTNDSRQTTSRTLKSISTHAQQRTEVVVNEISELAAKELAAWVKVSKQYRVEAESKEQWIIRVL